MANLTHDFDPHLSSEAGLISDYKIMPQSGLFSLNSNDYVKGLITAIFSGIKMVVIGIISAVGFDIFTADWKKIVSLAVAGAITGGIGYLQKNLLTDQNGKVAGVIPTK